MNRALEAILHPLGVRLDKQEPSPSFPQAEPPQQRKPLPPGMINQVWFCDQCHAIGSVQLRTSIDYYEALDAVRAAHRELAPDCNHHWGTAYIRVINSTMVTSRASLFLPDIPAWTREKIAELMDFPASDEEQSQDM